MFGWFLLCVVCVALDDRIPPLKAAQGGKRTLKNCKWWKAEERLSGLHALLVAAIGTMSTIFFFLGDWEAWNTASAPPDLVFGATHEDANTTHGIRLAAVGLDLFASWMLTELIIKLIVWKVSRGLYVIRKDLVYFVHHLCTGLGGTVCRGLWGGAFEVPMLVSVMLTLEWSTLPLVLRNLTVGRYDGVAKRCVGMFTAMFALRLVPFGFVLWGLTQWWWAATPRAVAIIMLVGILLALLTNLVWAASFVLQAVQSKDEYDVSDFLVEISAEQIPKAVNNRESSDDRQNLN